MVEKQDTRFLRMYTDQGRRGSRFLVQEVIHSHFHHRELRTVFGEDTPLSLHTKITEKRRTEVPLIPWPSRMCGYILKEKTPNISVRYESEEIRISILQIIQQEVHLRHLQSHELQYICEESYP